MSMKLFIAILLSGLVMGCSTQKSANNIEPLVIKITMGLNQGTEKINEYLKFSHYVPLETNDEALIGEIGKIQIFNNKFYILCKKRSAVFIFDENGMFLSKIGNVGRGPGEYLSISDFETTSDGMIHINDPLQGKIYTYDESGLFQYDKQLPRKIWSFSILPHNMLACNMANGVGMEGEMPAEYNYACFSEDGTALFESIPVNRALIGRKVFNGNNQSLFYRYDDTIFMSSILNDSIYTVSRTSGKLLPYIAFNFNVRRPKINSSPDVHLAHLESVTRGEMPSAPYHFYHLRNNNVMFYYNYSGRPYVTIVSPSGELLFSSNVGYDEHGIMTLFTPLIDSDNTGYVIQAASSANIYDWIDYRKQINRDHALLSQIANRINYDSNPVLLLYKCNE